MVGDIITSLMARPRLLAVVLAVMAGLAWRREDALDAVAARWELVLLAIAGLWIGWAFRPEVHSLVELVPL